MDNSPPGAAPAARLAARAAGAAAAENGRSLRSAALVLAASSGTRRVPAHLRNTLTAGRELAVAWMASAPGSIGASADAADGRHGPASSAFLRVRLAEVYRLANARNVSVRATHALGIVTPRADVDGPAQARRMRAIVVEEFGGGETVAEVHAGRFVVLGARAELPARLGEIRTATDSLAWRMWMEPLPDDAVFTSAVIDELMNELTNEPYLDLVDELRWVRTRRGRRSLAGAADPDRWYDEWRARSDSLRRWSLDPEPADESLALLAALADARPVAAALTRHVGGRRAAGATLLETIDELVVLLGVVDPGARDAIDHLGAVALVADGFAEESTDDGEHGCLDALTGLPSREYARRRHRELRAACRARRIGPEAALTAVLARPAGSLDGLDRLTAPVDIAAAVTALRAPTECVAMTGDGGVAMVVAHEDSPSEWARRLRARLGRRYAVAEVPFGELA